MQDAMRTHVAVLLGAVVAILAATGCPPPTPTPISVTAGPDQNVKVGATGTAMAVVTDATGTVTFAWTITAPGTITAGADAATVSFTGSSAGTATLSVTASDSGTGTSSSASVQITFQPVAALAANAGADASVEIGSLTQLNGSATGGAPPYTFQWQQISGPVQTISPASGAGSVLALTGTAAGTAEFQLSVTDAASQTATDTVAVTVIPPGMTLTFTEGTDDLLGGAGDDTFNAPIVVLSGFGAVQTLNFGDRATGGGGNDTLNAVLNGNSLIAGPLSPTLTDIQTLNITDLAGAPLNAIGITGVRTIRSVNSLLPSNIQNLGELVDAAIVDSATAGLILNYTAAPVSGSADAMTLTLSNAGAGQLIIITPGTATSSVETITINSTGQPNMLVALAEAGGTPTLAAVNVTGDKDLTITAGMLVSVLNAATFTGNLNMVSPLITITGATVTGGSGNDRLTGSPFTDTIVGGAGDDTLSGLTGVDTLTLGSGADIVQLTAATALGVDRKIVTDFDDTPTTGDKVNVAVAFTTLTGTNNFATGASLQGHTATGALAVAAPTEVVIVTSGTVANFTDANSLNGTNLLTAIGAATVTVPGANSRVLFAVADAAGNVGVYLGNSGADAVINAAELTLVAVLQGANVNIANLGLSNFSNS